MNKNQIYKKSKILNTASWRTFLDVDTNQRVETFLKEHGYDVLNQTTQNINKAFDDFLMWDEIALLVHPNSSTIMLITKPEFNEVLDFCLKWFTENEYYEMCSYVLETKEKIRLHAQQQSGEKTS